MIALLLALLLACAARHEGPPRPGDSVAARAAGLVEVRYRPVFEPPSPEAAWLVGAVAGGQWDEGLAAAARELLALHVDRGARIDAPTASLVAARAGYPGQVRFVRALTGGARPEELVTELGAAAQGGAERPVDLGLAVRHYDDGTSLWVLAWCLREAELDPLPRDLALDQSLPVRVDLVDPALRDAELRLYVAPPVGQVEEISLTQGVARWVDRFHSPGEHRLEVVAQKDGRSLVALVFSIWVDEAPRRPAPLGAPATQVEDPIAAERSLFDALNALRQANGLPPVEWFPVFEPLVREHSAFMASQGRAEHVLPGLSPGVAAKAKDFAFPYAFHHEAVATAPTAREALELVLDSPAHKGVLLCAPCTHATVGVAIEPVLGRVPRLFVTWELIEIPKGPPRRIDALER